MGGSFEIGKREVALRQMGVNQNNAQNSMEKLASGLRINKAGDDAAGLAISEKMRAQIRGLDQASRNSQDGISMIQTAEGALQETHNILQRMRELATQAANDTNVEVDRLEIQKEMNQLTSEINRIGNTTEFNTQNVLRGQTNGLEGNVQYNDSGISNLAVDGNSSLTGGSYKLQIEEGEFAGNLESANESLTGVDAQSGAVAGNYTVDVSFDSDIALTAGDTGITSVTYDGTDPDMIANGNKIEVTEDDGVFTITIKDSSDSVLGTATGTGDDFAAEGVKVGDFTVTAANLTEPDLAADPTPETQGTFNVTGDAWVASLDGGNTTTQISSGTATIDNIELTFDTDKLEVGTAGTFSVGDVKLTLEDGNGDVVAGSETVTTKDSSNVAIGDTGVSVNVAASIDDTKEVEFAVKGGGDFTSNFQIGANSGQSFTINIADMRSAALSVSGSVEGDTITASNGQQATLRTTQEVTDGTDNNASEFALDVTSHDKAQAAISVINDAIESVSAQRSELGAFQNRLEHTISNLGTSAENLQAAESRIRDVDMAREVMEMTKNNILSQASQAMLAQANQAPQAVLQLLG